MNLTKQPIYQKGGKKKASKSPTAEDKRRWSRLIELGCAVGPVGCFGRLTIHHCFTGGGGRKAHEKTICLCAGHHQGPDGIDGREYGCSKRTWQQRHDTEANLLAKVNKLLGENA